MVTTVEEAFMEDVLANPDDDAPRLIFADWFDEHGQPDRAEFIRVQCEWARLPEYDERRRELERRERELLAGHEEEWLGEAAAAIANARADRPIGCMARGFLDCLTLTPTDLALRGAKLYAHGPLTRLYLLPDREGFGRLAESPFVGHLRGVFIDDGVVEDLPRPTWDDVSPLVLYDRLTGLRELGLAGIPLNGRAVSRLLEARGLGGLRSLDLRETTLTGTAAEQLANCAALRELRTLSLGSNAIGTLGAQFLAASRQLVELESLDLHQNGVTAAGVRALTWSGRLVKLRELSLFGNPLGNDGASAVAHTTLKHLTWLNLSRTDMGRQGLSALAESPLIRQLKSLDVSANVLGDKAVPILCRAQAALEYLDFGKNELTDAGAKVLGGWAGLSTLRTLGLQGNGLTAFGLKDLLSSPHLGRVEQLLVSGNRLRDLGARVLAEWAGLGRIRDLHIAENEMTDEGMLAILRSPHFIALNSLYVRSSEFGEEVRHLLEGMEQSGRIEFLI